MLDQTKTSSMTSTRTKRVLHLLPPSAYSDMCRRILTGKENVGLLNCSKMEQKCRM